jgi:hypothetical protein
VLKSLLLGSLKWLLEEWSKLVSNFKGASLNFEFGFLSTKKQTIVKNYEHMYRKYLIFIISLQYSSRDTLPLSQRERNLYGK